MLKADPGLSAEVTEELFNKVWDEEKVPDTWKKGIVVKLPKKGVPTLWENRRGIHLLSVFSVYYFFIRLPR